LSSSEVGFPICFEEGLDYELPFIELNVSKVPSADYRTELGVSNVSETGAGGALTIIFSTIPLDRQHQQASVRPISALDQPCLEIEVAELAVGGLDLPRVNLGILREDVLPPGHVINLLQMDQNDLLIL